VRQNIFVAINNNLEEQVSLVFNSMFSKHSAKEIELENIIEVKDGTHDSPKPQASGFNLITSKHLLSYGVDKSTANFITEADYNKINERSAVSQYDVLMSMIGTVGLVSLVIEPVIDFAIKNVALFKTSLTPNLIYYFLCFLRSRETQQYIEMCLAGSTQKYISLGELRKIPIKIPSSEELTSFNEIVTPIFRKIITNVEENSNLIKIRDTLLPKLMSSELSVSDVDI